MNLSRRSLLLGAGALGLGPLAACAQHGGEAPEDALTIGLTYIPNVQFANFYVAVARGIFADHGLDVALRHHGAQEDLFTAALTEQEDLVYASSDEVTVAAANGSPLQTFATCFQTYPVVIQAADPTITDFAQLRGARIGLPGYFGSNYYGYLAALASAGMTEADVEGVEIGFTQVSALVTEQVDAVVGFSNNESVQFAQIGLEFAELPVQNPASPSLVGPGLVTVRDRTDPAVLRTVRDAVLDAQRLIVDDPAVAIEATREHVPTLTDDEQRRNAEGVLEATIELWHRDGELSLDVNADDIERMGNFLTDAGIIDAPPADTVAQL